MPVETPGYRLLFNSTNEYEDLLSTVAPVARSVVEDRRVWQYTRGIAGKMRYLVQMDQHARELLYFIHDRRKQPEFMSCMWTVLQDQPGLKGCLRRELGTFEAANTHTSKIEQPAIPPINLPGSTLQSLTPASSTNSPISAEVFPSLPDSSSFTAPHDNISKPPVTVPPTNTQAHMAGSDVRRPVRKASKPLGRPDKKRGRTPSSTSLRIKPEDEDMEEKEDYNSKPQSSLGSLRLHGSMTCQKPSSTSLRVEDTEDEDTYDEEDNVSEPRRKKPKINNKPQSSSGSSRRDVNGLILQPYTTYFSPLVGLYGYGGTILNSEARNVTNTTISNSTIPNPTVNSSVYYGPRTRDQRRATRNK